MKDPVYNPREIAVLENASAIIARAYTDGQWRESEILPDDHTSTLIYKLETAQRIMRDRKYHRIGLYAQAVINGEVSIVALPADYIPKQVEELLLIADEKRLGGNDGE